MSSEVDRESVLDFTFELRSLVTELNAALAGVFRPLGLTCVQAEALLALEALGPATLKELSEHLVAESGHPSRLVSRLVAEELIIRTTSEKDGRAVVLELSGRGMEAAARARAAREPLLEKVAQRFGARLVETASVLRELRSVMR